MLGQRMTIRIVTDRFLEVQHMNRYRYEVVSKAKPLPGLRRLDLHRPRGRPEGRPHVLRAGQRRDVPASHHEGVPRSHVIEHRAGGQSFTPGTTSTAETQPLLRGG